ncbi:ATPase inhibitor subunit zeta [Donghicola sp. XS_ASV15]|uniref:ATPase inhibitor subunit zeta n=1 Tax=Donghicola sp. XS_ASV15 TaxID=3241295 RepID=UPI0035116AA6
MSIFEDRERAFEAKAAYDEEKAFRVSSLRDRMMAAWAADILGKTGAEAEAYVNQIVRDQIAGHASLSGPDALLDRLSVDLEAAVSSATVAAHISLSEASAREKIENGN